MVSKCANPECAERFLYLGQGKLFHLIPTPNVEAIRRESHVLYERFWLCDQCSKKMTLVWGGTEAKVVRLPAQPVAHLAIGAANGKTRQKSKRRAATAGLTRR
jgi:hypothetical protein